MNEEEKKAIEKIKEIIECFYSFPNPISIELRDCDCSTLEIALNLIEKLKKEHEELDVKILSNAGIYQLGFKDGEESYIKKVKDKIEKEIKYHEKNILEIENITMLKSKTAKEKAGIEFNKYAIVVLKKMLQELLEGRK